MEALVLNRVDAGLNLRLPATEIADEQAAGSKNILYRRGIFQTPFGFSKLGETGLPLDGPILAMGSFKGQRIAVTPYSIYTYTPVGDTWTEISPTTALDGDPDNHVSMVAVPHTDPIAIDGTGGDAYEHLLVCDGLDSPIVRWAGPGETKFYPLAGAEGYHETDVSPATPTDHYAKQVLIFHNHVVLLSPKQWDATSNIFLPKDQTVLWGKPGKLEGDNAFYIADTGAGYVDLVDTGDENVWAAQLGNLLIIYQSNSIWSLSHVGGADVFRSRLEMPNLSLLSPSLLLVHNRVHYFIGNDFYLYRYYGGITFDRIGIDIRDALKADIEEDRVDRCRMALGANKTRLWFFIVPSGGAFATKAYGMDLDTGAWMVRDYSDVFSAGSGLISVDLVGASSYVVGITYQQAINTGETYQTAIDAGETYQDLVEEILTEERLSLGDSDGNVYRYDSELTTDDGQSIDSYHITKAFDYKRPDELKWWTGISITAKGTSMVLSYRITGFESDSGNWNDFAVLTLTSEYVTYDFFLDGVSSYEIQFKIANSSGGTLYVRGGKLHKPEWAGEL